MKLKLQPKLWKLVEDFLKAFYLYKYEQKTTIADYILWQTVLQ